MKHCAASKLSEIDDREGGCIEVIQPPSRSSICDVFTQRNASFYCLIAPKFFFLFLLALSSLSARPVFQEPWGQDSDLRRPKKTTPIPPKSLATRVADAIICFHQEVISPVDGPRSSFRPTSSRYMQLAMQRYGFIKGFLMGCDRLLRENDEQWVYPVVQIDGRSFKFDPATEDKSLPIKG